MLYLSARCIRNAMNRPLSAMILERTVISRVPILCKHNLIGTVCFYPIMDILTCRSPLIMTNAEASAAKIVLKVNNYKSSLIHITPHVLSAMQQRAAGNRCMLCPCRLSFRDCLKALQQGGRSHV